MHLAMRLGRTLDELAHSMTAQEFGLWLALYERDPWDESRADIRAGIVAATVANYAGMMRKQGASPALPRDFMPFNQSQDEPEQTEEPDPLAHFSQYLR